MVASLELPLIAESMTLPVSASWDFMAWPMSIKDSLLERPLLPATLPNLQIQLSYTLQRGRNR